MADELFFHSLKIKSPEVELVKTHNKQQNPLHVIVSEKTTM